MRLKVLIPLLFMTITAVATAGTLTVESAVQEALAQRPDMARTRAMEGAASWKRLETLSGHLPRLSVDATHFVDNKFQVTSMDLAGHLYEIPSAYAYSTLNVDVSMTVFDGFKTIKNYQASRLQYQATQKDLSRLELQVRQEVRLRFFQALAAKDIADVAVRNVKTLTEHHEIIQLRLKNGLATRLDILQAEVRLEEAKAERMSALDNVVLARRELARVMGLDGDERALEGVLPEPKTTDLPSEIQAQLEGRDDLVAKTLRGRAARKEAGANASFWWPSATVFAEKQFYNNQDYTLDASSFRDAYMLGGKLSWNLFDGGASLAKRAQSTYRADQADADVKEAVLRAGNDVEFWRRRYLYSCALYQARVGNIVKAEESVRLAELGYKNGTRSNSEVLDAVLEWTQAKAGRLRAQVDALDAFQNLQLAVGNPMGSSTP